MKIIYELEAPHVRSLHALYQNEWWSKGRTLEETATCVENSQVCIALVDDADHMRGFARVLTDYIFKALILDLIITKECRNERYGEMALNAILNHPRLQGVRHFELYCLPQMAGFYEKYGFTKELGGLEFMRHSIPPSVETAGKAP